MPKNDLNTALLKQQLKSGELKNLYVIYGSENYLKNLYYKKITGKAVTDFESFNLQIFEGIPDMAVAASAVSNMPLMSPYKCVVFKDLDTEQIKSSAWNDLKNILKSIPQECILIFYFDALNPNEKKDSKFQLLLKHARKEGLALNFAAPDSRSLTAFLSKQAKNNGCEIDDSVLRYLIEKCGNDINTLTCELDKVCAFASGRNPTKEDVDAVAVEPMNSSAFEIANNIIFGRTDKALSIVNELFNKKEKAILILSALSTAFCDLYRAKAASKSGVGTKSVVNDFGYYGRDFAVEKAMSMSSRIDMEYLADCLAILLKADIALKSDTVDERALIEKTIIEISLLRRNGRQ